MIEFLLISLLILFLYFKTWKYCWNIDDHVPRKDYLWVVPPPPHKIEHQLTRRDKLATFTNIGTYILVCGMIQYLWGWKVALLYAVYPTNVSGVAWGKTGNYYMTTVFLILTSYFFLLYKTIWGTVISAVFYYSALESTVSAIPFFAVSFLYPYGWINLIPVIKFMTGKRFVTGIKRRKNAHKEFGIESAKLHLRNILTAIAIIGYYIRLSFGVIPLGFFHTLGRRGEQTNKINKYFYVSILTIISFSIIGLVWNPFGLFWFLMFIGVFSQIVPNLGQFVTERYMYLANIGFCLILNSFLGPLTEAYWFIIGIWIMITINYIPAWKSNEHLFSHSLVSFPDCPDNYTNLAGFYLDKKDFFSAIKPCLGALRACKEEDTGQIHINLGNCYSNCGFYAKALYHYRESLKYAFLKDIDPIKKQIWKLEQLMEKIRKNEKLLKERGII